MRDGDEAFAVGERQRPQHHGVDEREDRRCRADAKSVSRDNDCGEHRCARVRAQRVAHVPPHVFDERNAAERGVGLPDTETAAERGERARLRFIGAQPEGAVIGDRALEVIPYFVLEIALHSRRSKQRHDPGDEHAK